jgi:hypothetical protein
MIDLATEELIPLSEVPKLLPRRRTGRTIHLSAIYRWRQKGIKGIRLETATLGGTTYTSKEALARFCERLTGNHQEQPTPTSRMSRGRQAQAARAAQEVQQQLGITKPSPKKQPNANSRTGFTPDAPSVRYGNNAQTLSKKEVDGETTM